MVWRMYSFFVLKYQFNITIIILAVYYMTICWECQKPIDLLSWHLHGMMDRIGFC